MKTITKVTLLLFIACLLSCTDNNDMLTVINKDGSCYREFVSKVDSTFMTGNTRGEYNPFPVDLDSTWNITWQYEHHEPQARFPLTGNEYNKLVAAGKKVQNGTDFIASICRHYRSVDEMGRLFRLKSSHEWSGMKVSYDFEKKFRWFYTYYIYREHYPKLKHSFSPLQKYMNDDEIQFWFTGNPNLLQGMNGIEINDYINTLNDKYNKWVSLNYWDTMYDVLVRNYDRLELLTTKDRFTTLKDTLFEQSYGQIENEGLKMAEYLDRYFKTSHIFRFWNAKNSPAKQADEAFAKQNFLQYLNKSFTYKLMMPGDILEAGNAVLHNDTLVWRLTAYRMFYDNYTIEAKSRTTNTWAFIVTTLIVLTALFCVLYKPKRKRS